MKIMPIGCALLVLQTSCHSTQVVDHRPLPYQGLGIPTCSSVRPIPLSGMSSAERHACWRWGLASDLARGASCRITQAGALMCWSKSLVATPTGVFAALDEGRGYACAIDAERLPRCWGEYDGAPVDWSSTPTIKLRSVSVGQQSPFDIVRSVFACGVTETDEAVCWSSGMESELNRLPGRYRSVEAGHARVCAITMGKELECWRVGKDRRIERDPNAGGVHARVSLGADTMCLLDGDVATCSGSRELAASASMLDGLTEIHAGTRHACGVDRAGFVKCVGVARPPPAIRFSEISDPGASDNYCGATYDGEAYCWGDPAL